MLRWQHTIQLSPVFQCTAPYKSYGIIYSLKGICYLTVSTVRYRKYCINRTVSTVPYQLYGIGCTVSTVWSQLYDINCTASTDRYLLHCGVLHCIIQGCTELYCTVVAGWRWAWCLKRYAFCSAVQCSAVWCCPVWHSLLS